MRSCIFIIILFTLIAAAFSSCAHVCKMIAYPAFDDWWSDQRSDGTPDFNELLRPIDGALIRRNVRHIARVFHCFWLVCVCPIKDKDLH